MMGRNSIIRVAHRGASAGYPENTLLALRQAIQQGVDALEVDIHRTADDELIVIHDSTLERTSNGHGNVVDHRLQEIRQLDAGRGEKIPLFTEAIDLAREAQVRLYVEVKGATEKEELAIAEGVIRTLEESDFLNQTIITSFSAKALLRAKALHPEAATMLDPSPQDGSLTPSQICAQVLRAGANCLSYDFRFLTPAIVRECQLRGLTVWAWPPDEPQDIQRALRLDVQGIVTDRPDTLNEVLHDITL